MKILSKSYVRLKVIVDMEKPLMVGFWWKNSEGNEIWANIKYVQLYDFFYGCRRLGHTTKSCKEDVKKYETKLGHLLYGPWLIGTRPKKTHSMRMSGGMEKRMP